MKAKRPTVPRMCTSKRHEEILPHELGTHLFAMIRRNLSARRETMRVPVTQMTFAFQS